MMVSGNGGAGLMGGVVMKCARPSLCHALAMREPCTAEHVQLATAVQPSEHLNDCKQNTRNMGDHPNNCQAHVTSQQSPLNAADMHYDRPPTLFLMFCCIGKRTVD